MSTKTNCEQMSMCIVPKTKQFKKLGYKNQHDFNKNSTQLEKDELDNKVTGKLNDKPVNLKRCKGNTWFIPYDTINNRNKHRGSHPATFPIKLYHHKKERQSLLIDN